MTTPLSKVYKECYGETAPAVYTANSALLAKGIPQNLLECDLTQFFSKAHTQEQKQSCWIPGWFAPVSDKPVAAIDYFKEYVQEIINSAKKLMKFKDDVVAKILTALAQYLQIDPERRPFLQALNHAQVALVPAKSSLAAVKSEVEQEDSDADDEAKPLIQRRSYQFQ